METIIIITSLVVLTGFVKIFSNRKDDLARSVYNEESSLFVVPSVLNNLMPGKLLSKLETIQNDEDPAADEVKKFANQFHDEEEIHNDFEEHMDSEHNQLNKKAIVYKSVTKRMTLVQVF